MISGSLRGASLVALGVSIALANGSALAQGAAQKDEGEEMNVITVTGSRTITENVRSPTPITSVEIEEIAVTTPSDTADALNKLPNILGGRTPRTQGNGSTNNGGNVLSLRNFGPSRTLVLLDGHRVAPSNQDGTVNIDVLPQMLMKRVDIVTGGASAIYGSDAVAGVVNFVLDKEFTGLSVKADYGLSKYGDGDEYQLGAAWGAELFEGRAHFETAARFRHQDMIPIADRPYGKDGQAWLLTGTGSVASPYTNTPYARVFNSPEHGNVNCGPACGFNGYTFDQAGILSPLTPGTPVNPPGNVQSGGDGAYVKYGTFRSEIEMKDVFARFSFDLGEHTSWYLEGSWAQAENASDWINWVVSPSPTRPNTLFANNPYLPLATQQQLGANIVCGTPAADGLRCLPASPPTSLQDGSKPPAPPATPFFSVPSYLWNTVDGEPANGNPNRLYRTLADQKTWNAQTGFTGELGGLNWDFYYNHSNSELTVLNPNNTDNAKYLAALDAVDDNGTIRCWVTTQPEFASLYPGCVPLNITDPNGPSAEAYDYLRTPTSWTLTQKLDDVGFSIGGGLWGAGLPAGEIRANLSVDMRWATYTMDSDFLPTDYVNCTGLRMCLSNPANPNRPDLAAPVRWVQNTNAAVDAKNDVWEAALEFNIPLLKDVPGFQELSTNLAYRYTKYSNFDDAVDSWKFGLDWHIDDTVRFRGTYSSDIRAPNLNDLYQPQGVSSTGFQDILTGQNNSLRLITSGNEDLTPEEARTLTLGMVITPTALPRFSFSVDYYRTEITDAITAISYQSAAVQNLCIASAPAFDSPFCNYVIRPITDPTDPLYRTAANFPLAVISRPLNTATQKTHGYDFEIAYNWDMAGGNFSIRHLASYQPENTTIALPGAFPTWAIQPHLTQTTFINCRAGSWTAALQNRWLSSTSVKTSDNARNGNSQNYVDSSLDAYDVVDVTLSKQFAFGDSSVDGFLTVSNLFNERAPLFGSGSGIPGLFYPTQPFYDDMGRYFTVGARMKF